MTDEEEREAVTLALMAIGDQVQEICARAPVEISAFVLFSSRGPVEYRSPHPRALVVEHMRLAADELEREP